MTTSDRELLLEPKRENHELKRAHEILHKASAFFVQAQLNRRPKYLSPYIDEHQDAHAVESICKQLPISPSTYYEHKARENDPDRWPERAKRDESLRGDITAGVRRELSGIRCP
jgi:hypothetical protein